MTRISFYILNSTTLAERQAFACRLAEKIYHQGHQLYIHTEDSEACQKMNEALWSHRPESFLPHDIVSEGDIDETPILIGFGDHTPPRLMDTLINLADTHPLFFSQFNRVAEVIDANEDVKQAGRSRYQFYKHRGYELDTFNI
jgi:DNA polymerase-3 subunit chi